MKVLFYGSALFVVTLLFFMYVESAPKESTYKAGVEIICGDICK